ncbi:MAG TPA: hypothetical protein VGP72_22035 [Planctomycetota bacterium]
MKRFAFFLLACVLAGFCAECLAAESVIVSRKNGKKAFGELLEASGEKLVVRDADGNNVDIPWADIQKVSNGLTQEKAAEQWRQANADKVCPACQGAKVTVCKKCKGSGQDPSRKVTCPKCNGAGSGRCTAKGCVNGMVDCPNSCLKLSEGKWESRDGVRWRSFPRPGGWAEWSERHLGEVIAIENGNPVNKGRCPQCDGKTKVKCGTCNGTSEATCAFCKGQKEAPAPCPACKEGKLVCDACKGTGLKP